MNRALLFLYRFLLPPVTVALPFAALFSAKVRAGLRLRKGPLEPLDSTARPLWIHAASGEFEYAKAVIRELNEQHPEIPIVVTYFSPTFAAAIARFPGVTRAMALPLDLPGPCAGFLRRIQPRLLLIARTDLWPEMLEQCRLRNIPVVLFSYTQKAVRSPLKKIVTRWLLSWVRCVYCVASEDGEHLLRLNPSLPVTVIGDTRYDQVAERLNHPRALTTQLHPADSIPVLVAGSTWPEDESVLLPALTELLKTRRLRLILVPHEPTSQHLDQLKTTLHKSGLAFALFSAGQTWEHESVLLVDQVGYLAELYTWGEFAFIGGSFRRSVHSVMEALGAGCLSFVGPYHHNNREAIEFKNLSFAGHSGLEVVCGAKDMRAKVTQALDVPIAAFRSGLQAEFNHRLGASRELVHRIHDLLR